MNQNLPHGKGPTDVDVVNFSAQNSQCFSSTRHSEDVLLEC